MMSHPLRRLEHVRAVAIAAPLLAALAVLVVLILPAHAGAAFPGKNGRIAFESARAGGFSSTEIFTMRADGTQARRVTHTGGTATSAAFSSNGKRIVFLSDFHHTHTEISTIRADGTHLRRLTHSPPGTAHESPGFSPNGKTIVFETLDESLNHGSIYKMRANGTHLRLLTDKSSFEPSFSPSGKRIVFDSDRVGGFNNYEIYTMRADGTHQRALTHDSGDRANFFPDFSPNGKKIVFETVKNNHFTIDVMRADGTHRHRVSRATGAPFKGEPTFSPSGNKIAYVVAGLGGPGEIHVMRTDGTHRRRLTHNSAADEFPTWGVHPQRRPSG